MDLLDDFLGVFDEWTYDSPEYGALAFHGLLGQALKWQRIKKGGSWVDPRVSFFFMQDSGTGKSVALEPIKLIAKQLKLDVVSITASTDAALIGTIEKHESGKGKEKKVEWRHVPGVLSHADIVHWDEGSILLRTDQHSMNTKAILQQALNPIGSESNILTKKLAHGEPIVIRPTCSLFITTYFPEEFEDVLLHTGLLQRVLVLPKEVTPEQRLDMSMQDVDRLRGPTPGLSRRLRSIGDELASIQKAYKHPKEWDFTPVIPVLKNAATKLHRVIATSSPQTRRLLGTFVPRYQNELYKLALHSAAVDDRTEVRPSDVRYAVGVVTPLLRAILGIVEVETKAGWSAIQKERKREYRLKQVFKKLSPDGLPVTSSLAIRAIMHEQGVSDSTARRTLAKATKSGDVSEVVTGNGVRTVKWGGS